MTGVPEGYRIERRELARRSFETGLDVVNEVRFEVVETADGRTISRPCARFDPHAGEWFVLIGQSTYGISPDKARARAAGLVMAADEADRRNGEGR